MTTWQQLFCSHTHPRPLGWDIKVKTFFLSVSSHVAYQIKGNEVYDDLLANYFALTHTLDPWGGI